MYDFAAFGGGIVGLAAARAHRVEVWPNAVPSLKRALLKAVRIARTNP